ncbi:hypothetical protein LSH36_63g04044 [Paralvinella palmiformis]|uniref:Uncharacterized protein n=1 Tax=Paralvinella palmiformis TaxID=53620 RepID=A0AAD9NEP1_9ANNE|nr:hypothetical protein LSH36_63g04044 [Paralvinella palmiformis]
MPQRSEPTKETFARKQKARSKLVKRRKSAARRRSSGVQDDPVPNRPVTPGVDSDDVRAHLFIEGTDAIQKDTQNPDLMAIVSPESYKEYTEVHRDRTKPINCLASNSRKSDPDTDHVSVCSVSSYTRSRIENIVQNPDILNCDSSSSASTISNGFESVKRIVVSQTDSPLAKTEITNGSSSNPEEKLDHNDPEFNGSTVELVGADDNASGYVSNESDFELESRRKTLDWLNASNDELDPPRPSPSGQWVGSEGSVEQPRKENVPETRRILLHIPQAGSEKVDLAANFSEQKMANKEYNSRLSVVLTNGISSSSSGTKEDQTEIKTRPKQVNPAIRSASGIRRQAWQNGVSWSRDQRPVSACQRAHQRHAELQQQSERLLKKKQEIMEQFRLRRWVPILPDTIAIDDLIVINTIRREMHQQRNIHGRLCDFVFSWSSFTVRVRHSLGSFVPRADRSDGVMTSAVSSEPPVLSSNLLKVSVFMESFPGSDHLAIAHRYDQYRG